MSNQKTRDSRGDVGIWHETFRVAAGQYETIYSGMPARGLSAFGKVTPARGLSAFGKVTPAVGRKESARERIVAGELTPELARS